MFKENQRSNRQNNDYIDIVINLLNQDKDSNESLYNILKTNGNGNNFQIKNMPEKERQVLLKMTSLFVENEKMDFDPNELLSILQKYSLYNKTNQANKLRKMVSTYNDITQKLNNILKHRATKKGERPNRLRAVQREKQHMVSFQNVQNMLQGLKNLPKIALFSELIASIPDIQNELKFYDDVMYKIREFWNQWPKDYFLNCNMELQNTEMASNFFKEILTEYSSASFFAEDIEDSQGLIENILKASVLQFGRKKASFSIFERICESLSNRSELKNSILLSNLNQKKEICEKLRYLEAKIRAFDVVSYGQLVHITDLFSIKCNEVDLKTTEDYLNTVIRKAEPILSNIAPTMQGIAQAVKNPKKKIVTQEELKKQVHTLKPLPFIFEETNQAINLLKISEELEARSISSENIIGMNCLELLRSEYNCLGIKINSIEIIFKKFDCEKVLIESLHTVFDDENLSFTKGYKTLLKLLECKYLKSEQAEVILINAIIYSQLQKLVEDYGSKKCKKGEKPEEIFEKMTTSQKVDFQVNNSAKIEELEKIYKKANHLKENCKNTIDWDKKFSNKNKSIEFLNLNDTVNFLDKVLQEVPENNEHAIKVKHLPWGSFLEDFSSMTEAPRHTSQNEISDDFKKSLDGLRKNIIKNSFMGLPPLAAQLEAKNLLKKLRMQFVNRTKFEQVLFKIVKILKRLRLYKLDAISKFIRLTGFKVANLLTLMGKGENSLKIVEEKLKSKKNFVRMFEKGDKFYMRPDKLLKKEKRRKIASNLTANQKEFRANWRSNYDLTKFLQQKVQNDRTELSCSIKASTNEITDDLKSTINANNQSKLLNQQKNKSLDNDQNLSSTLLNNAISLLNHGNPNTNQPVDNKMNLETITTFSSNTNNNKCITNPEEHEFVKSKSYKQCVESQENWRGLRAHFRTNCLGKENSSRDFDIFFWGISNVRLPSPPMSIIFSETLTEEQFIEKIQKTIESPKKAIEIGAFRAFKTNNTAKNLNRKNTVLGSKLDAGVLYLFTKSQWPECLNSLQIENKITNDDLYCLQCFKPNISQENDIEASNLQKRNNIKVPLYELDSEMNAINMKKGKNKKNIFEPEKSVNNYYKNDNMSGSNIPYGYANLKDQDLSTSISNIMNGAPPANNSLSNQKKMYGNNKNQNYYNDKTQRFTRSGKKGKGNWQNQNNYYNNNNYGVNSNGNYSNSKKNNYQDRNFQQNYDNTLNPNQLQRPQNNQNFNGFNKDSSGEKPHDFYATNPNFPNNMDNYNNDPNMQRNLSNNPNDLLSQLNSQNNPNENFNNAVIENDQNLINNQQSGLITNDPNNSFNNVKIEKNSDEKSNMNPNEIIPNELESNLNNSQDIILQNNNNITEKEQNDLEAEKIKEMILYKPNQMSHADIVLPSKAKPIAKQKNYSLPDIPLDFNEFDTDYEENLTEESQIFMGLFRAFDLMNPEFFNGEDDYLPQNDDQNNNNYAGYDENFNNMNDFNFNPVSNFGNDFLNINNGLDYNLGAANYMDYANEMANMWNNMSENQTGMDVNQLQNNIDQSGAPNPFLNMMNVNMNSMQRPNQAPNNVMYRNNVENKDTNPMNNNFDMNFGLNMMNAMNFNNPTTVPNCLPAPSNDNTFDNSITNPFNNLNFNNTNFLMNFNDINTNWNKLLNNNTTGNNMNNQKPKKNTGHSKKNKQEKTGHEGNEILESMQKDQQNELIMNTNSNNIIQDQAINMGNGDSHDRKNMTKISQNFLNSNIMNLEHEQSKSPNIMNNEVSPVMGAFAVPDTNQDDMNNADSFRFEFSPNFNDDLEKNSDLVLSMISNAKKDDDFALTSEKKYNHNENDSKENNFTKRFLLSNEDKSIVKNLNSMDIYDSNDLLKDQLKSEHEKNCTNQKNHDQSELEKSIEIPKNDENHEDFNKPTNIHPENNLSNQLNLMNKENVQMNNNYCVNSNSNINNEYIEPANPIYENMAKNYNMEFNRSSHYNNADKQMNNKQQMNIRSMSKKSITHSFNNYNRNNNVYQNSNMNIQNDSYRNPNQNSSQMQNQGNMYMNSQSTLTPPNLTSQLSTDHSRAFKYKNVAYNKRKGFVPCEAFKNDQSNELPNYNKKM